MGINMEVAVTDVHKTLASVGAMCGAGNRVTVEKNGGGVIRNVK